MKKPKKNKPQPSQPSGKAEPQKPGPSRTETATVTRSQPAAPRVAAPPATETGGEPRASRSPVPALLVALLAALLYWGDVYILDHGGELDARVYQPYVSFKQIEDLQPKGEEEILRGKGLAVYNKICSPCHQPDGNGSAGLFFPPLAGSEWVQAKDPARIIRIVLHGLSGPIKVK